MALTVVCAPDSFKESMSARTAAEALAEGVHRVVPDAECRLVPMADGGEGTTRTVVDALGGEVVTVPCVDALGRPATAEYGWVAETGLAVIEVASACGLAQITPPDRDVRVATSRGVGQLVRQALDRGARRLLIGLGGSATNDAGTGMLAELGVRFLDADDADLPAGGAALSRLAGVDVGGLDPRLADCEIDLACDVDNPLCGASGASHVFGPQKGADPDDVLALDAALTRWADVVEPALGRTVRDLPGAGAAGGLGAAFLGVLDARPAPGVELVADVVGLASAVVGADWVLSGEGRIDAQTRHGKTPWGVTLVARAAGVPVVLFGGRVDPSAEDLLDLVERLVAISVDAPSLTDALTRAPEYLADAAERVVRDLLAARRS
ncbi:MAG: glycerate kinase [Propionicimonas sp.]|uniref:glycerate kinase n=1 Tax=Propionicimonas sp. TaxID=1955623 RepID=UPI003D0A1DC6